MDPVAEVVDIWLMEDMLKPRKDRRTATAAESSVRSSLLPCLHASPAHDNILPLKSVEYLFRIPVCTLEPQDSHALVNGGGNVIGILKSDILRSQGGGKLFILQRLQNMGDSVCL